MQSSRDTAPPALASTVTRLRSRLIGAGVATGFLVIVYLLLGTILLFGLQQIDQQARERLEGIAAAAGAQVDVAVHETFTDPAQTGSAAYEAAIARLVDLHNSLPVVQWMYTMRIVDSQLFYVLDTAKSVRNTLRHDTAGASAVMEPVDDFSLDDEPGLLPELLAGRIHSDTRSYAYGGRLLRTAEAPLKDADGQLVGMVAVDVDLADFESLRKRFSLLIGACAAVGLALATALGIATARMHGRLAHAMERLARESITDSLTGLNNRLHFNRSLESAIPPARRHDRKLTLLMFDIDHFKRINDTYGHPAGDEVLRALGSRLLRMVRGGEICCRVGGEEFAVLMPGADCADAERLYERLRTMMREPVTIAGKPIAVTISAGISELSPRDGTAADLLRTADIALYAAKQGGRDRAVRYVADDTAPDHTPPAASTP